MTVCLQTESDSSLPNYLQKTDLLNSPAFHIINVLFASLNVISLSSSSKQPDYKVGKALLSAFCQ